MSQRAFLNKPEVGSYEQERLLLNPNENIQASRAMLARAVKERYDALENSAKY